MRKLIAFLAAFGVGWLVGLSLEEARHRREQMALLKRERSLP